MPALDSITIRNLEIDLARHEVRRNNELVRLRPKALSMLLYLAQERGRTVSKAEIFDELWPDEFVTEWTLTTNMQRIRTALGPENADLITSVYGLGYRFADDGDPLGGSPAATVAMATGEFVGREAECTRLEALLPAPGSSGTVALLSGEQGIGKTRTAQALADKARERGVVIAVGRCVPGDSALPFTPWIDILRSLCTHTDAATLGPTAEETAIAARFPGLAEDGRGERHSAQAPTTESEARLLACEIATRLLLSLSQRVPLLLIFEDLHWADVPSLQIAEFVAREMADAPVMLLGTHRPLESHASDIREALGRLQGAHHTLAIALAGLSSGDVGRMATKLSGRPLAKELVERLYDKTDGNPLFVEHLTHHLVETGALDTDGTLRTEWSAVGIPQRLQEIVHTRLHRLTPPCRRVLGTAAVIGRRFDAATVARVQQRESGAELGACLATTIELLDEARGARIVTPLPEQATSYEFGHAVLQEHIYGTLGPAERSRRHWSVAEAMASEPGAERPARLAAIAGHLYRGVMSGSAERVVEALMHAAEKLASVSAYHAALQQYLRSLEVLQAHETDDPALEGRIYIGRAVATWHLGDTAESRRLASRAVELVRPLHDTRLLSRALLSVAPFTFAETKEVRSEWVERLEDALDTLPSTDSPERARLLAILSRVRLYHDRANDPPKAREAVEIATRLGDDALRVDCLNQLHAALAMPSDLAERLEVANEIIRIASQTGELESLTQGYRNRAQDWAQQSNFAAADADMREYERISIELDLPSFRWDMKVWNILRQTMRGDFADAFRRIDEAYEEGLHLNEQAALMYKVVQTETLHTIQTTVAGRSGVQEFLAETIAGHDLPRAMTAWYYMWEGRIDDAVAQADSLMENGTDGIFQDISWGATLFPLSEVFAVAGIKHRCEEIYRAMLPFESFAPIVLLSAIGNVGFNALIYEGTFARQMGLLAQALGRLPEAEHYARVGLALHETAESHPLAASSRYDLATILRERGGRANQDQARDHLNHARVEAERMGMIGLLERIAAVAAT